MTPTTARARTAPRRSAGQAIAVARSATMHDTKRPDARGADELARPDDEPEHDRRGEAVAALPDHPGCEHQRERGEERNQRLRDGTSRPS